MYVVNLDLKLDVWEICWALSTYHIPTGTRWNVMTVVLETIRRGSHSLRCGLFLDRNTSFSLN